MIYGTINFGDQVKANISPITAHYREFFNKVMTQKNVNFDSLFFAYTSFIEGLIKNHTENLDLLAKGYDFIDSGLVLETGEPITEQTKYKDVLKAIIKLFNDNKHKLDIIMLECIEKVENIKINREDFIALIKSSTTEKPAWQQYLIDKALTYPCGVRVVKKLDDVACVLKDFVNKPDNNNQDDDIIPPKEIKFNWKFLQETFRQQDGTEYSKKACEDAINMANCN